MEDAHHLETALAADPENSLEDRQRKNLRDRLFKKMRLGGTPQKKEQQEPRASRCSSGGERQQPSRARVSPVPKISSVSKSESSTKKAKSQDTKAVSPENRVLFEPSGKPSPVSSKRNSNDKPTTTASFLPTIQQAPSAESAATADTSSCMSTGSSNWLDAFGKQNKGKNLGMPQQNDLASPQPGKDPRFHYKRKVVGHTEQRRDNRHHHHHLQASSQECPRAGSTVMFSDGDQPMKEDSQVLLAPVIMPPSSLPKDRTPWKRPTKERDFVSPPAMNRSSVFETSHDAIAAAHCAEAPELAASSSQETSSSSAMSSLTASTTSSMASALVKRLVDKSSATRDTTKVRLQRQAAAIRSTPIRIKPRVKSQEVQATDQGYASVAKLSAWLADDPTSAKKVRHVRRGANVIAKSRRFEKDLEDVIVEENNIMTGAVREKKDWLKSAFCTDPGDGEDPHHGLDDSFQHDPNRHMMMMRTRPVNFDDDCAKSEFVVRDDAAFSISVSNKKKWLENAFKKEDGCSAAPMRLSFKAQSDIGPLRESRDDVTSRAKKMWQQKSEKRASDGPSSAQKPPARSPYHSSNQRPPMSREAMPRKTLEERMRDTLGSRTSAPSPIMEREALATTDNSSTSRHSLSEGVPVEEDKTPVDFRAARQILIQRSKNNGNELKIASKVQRRTDKFEKLNKDAKRRSSATGLLKPTWESNSNAGSDTSEGPSNSYTKSFVEDIAPKRSFEELP